MEIKIQGFVIYLSSKSVSSPESYGYWSGKNYVCQRELIPITDNNVTLRTKIYTSKKRAENALEKCLNRGYAYVMDGRIEELNK